MEKKFKFNLSKKKIIITSIIAFLMFASIMLIALYKIKVNKIVYTGEISRSMAYEQVKDGDEDIEGTDYVKFDAFFLRDLDGDGVAEGIRGICREIGKEDTLYMELNVQTAGYLKDAKIAINGENFYLQTALPKDKELKENYIGSNIKQIEFNDLSNGTQKLLTGIVKTGESLIGNNINNYSKENSVILTGIYVGEDGAETEIRKEVKFNVDWHGTARATIYSTTQNYSNLDKIVNEEERAISLSFSINTEETNRQLILKTNHVEGEIPELNGYEPTEVIYTGSNAIFNYDTSTKKFTIDRESTIDESGNVGNKLSRTNNYLVKVIYPIEAYESLGADAVEIRIPVKTYYEGYNNPNTEFTNPYKSNTAETTIVARYSNPIGTVAKVNVYVGKYISLPSYRYIVSKEKPLRIYNGISEKEINDTYQVLWVLRTGSTSLSTGAVLKETKTGETRVTDQFIKTDSTTESMENITKNVGIGFSGASSILNEDGFIKVYDDETDELLVTFTKENWNKYTSSNPYMYDVSVGHIRVETSNTKTSQNLYIYNIKEIDDEYITENYELEEFNKFEHIKSTLVGYLGESYINTDIHQAYYEAPISIANISLDKNTISTQETCKNEKIRIRTVYEANNNQLKWTNGTFLVKFPKEIIDINLNDISINNSQVDLINYEIIEENGNKFIKIITENETPENYTITLDVDLSPDPRVATTTKSIELYASNENGELYYYEGQDIYDVNNNMNTEEQVNFSNTSISVISPNSLLTNQIASNYDDKNSEVISPQIAEIKPIYAVVDQDKEEQTATIGVQIRNNYASTISEIKILGKIPFKGNTYVISEGNLNSDFTTKMTNEGIIVPEELKESAVVYYSENENPSKDLNDKVNGWKTKEEVQNWNNIKTFLIDLDNYIMPTGKEYVFNYTVKIPNGVEFNQVAYSHHGVYFSLDTENGKYRTQTEPNKLGFRIAEKYDLELQKYQKGKEKLVPGATYRFKEIIHDEEGNEVEGEAKTGVTNTEGKIKITNLYAEKVYEISEIKSPNDYELNEEVIRFISHVNRNTGELTVEKISGTTKEEIKTEKNEGENYKIAIKVEDEAKARLKITKVEQGTDIPIKGVRFKVVGESISSTGKILTTNINGEINLKGLKINEEYTLEEVKADGFYLASKIKFKIVNNEGIYSVEVIEGTINEKSITEIESMPTANITIENEKKPKYELELIKIQNKTNINMTENEGETLNNTEETTYLAGAKFKLYKGTKEIGEYITDEKGRIVIPNLYQYVKEKENQEDGKYILKETVAPEGYAKIKDICFKVENVDGTLKFIEELAEGQTAKQYIAEGNKVIVTVEDNPSFKLIKKDAETGELLANVKFAIYNVDEGEVPARNSKGEILGVKEIINGREYYIISTNENGEIATDLQEGLYKAVEVEADKKYNLINKPYYFGIGASREGKTKLKAEWAKVTGGSNEDQITTIIKTSDGGYIAGGYFVSSTIDLGNGIVLNNKGAKDGIIIKYTAEGEIEWSKTIGGNNNDNISSVAELLDGGYIVGGHFASRSIDLGNGIVLNNKSMNLSDGMIIKYNTNGEIEWAKGIGGDGEDQIKSISETNEGGYIVGGHFTSSTIDLGNDIILNNSTTTSYSDVMIIKYNANDEIEWAKGIEGNKTEQIVSVDETSDGGYIAVGYFASDSINLGNDIVLNNYNGGYYDGMIIKYSANGQVEWTKGIGGTGNDRITTVSETSDGGYIAGGYFNSNSIVLENGVVLNNNGTNTCDGMIIKYNTNCEIEWATSVGGSGNDYINSISETLARDIIVGGYFVSSTIDLGNGVILNNNNNDYDGMIIKYSSNGKAEWANVIGGSSFDTINSVLEISNGEYMVVGYYNSKDIDLGNGIIINNNGNYDGVIIKYNEVQVPEVIIKQAKSIGGSNQDYINSITETNDGGYIVGGYFKDTIQVGDYILTSKGSYDGMIIKYDANGQVEWAKSIGGDSNDYINSVCETIDGGIIAGGYFYSSSIQVGDYTLTNKGQNDGMIIKCDANGQVEWAKSVGGTNSDVIESVKVTKDGGYIVGGYFKSDIQVGVYTLANKGDYDGIIIKYNENGDVEWAKSVGESGTDEILSVTATNDGGCIAGGYFSSNSMDLGNDIVLTNKGNDDGMIIKYAANGQVEWAKVVGESGYDEITSVIEAKEGGYVVGGHFRNSTIDFGNGMILKSVSICSDGIIIKYDAKGEVEWAKSVGGWDDEEITSITETSDGGYIVVGNFETNNINLGNEIVLKNNGTKNYYDGMIIKYNANGEIEWAKGIGGSGKDEITSVTEISDGSYIVGGYFESSTIDLENRIVLNNNGYYDGMLIKIVEEMGVPDVEELIIDNERKEFKITTDVNEIDKIKGGSISGEDSSSYEKVKYGDNSTKEIVMIPEEGYEIIGITVNGENYQFTVNADGSYFMPLFENMQENKHIEVTYALKENKIVINKIDSKTKEKLKRVIFKLEQIEERTKPNNVIKELIANGQEYTKANIENEIIDVKGELTNNGTYYFIEQDGKYVPTNSKTYQIANGGTAGIQNVTANSYIPIDLSGKDGKYVVVVNAEITSESADYGYATITETTTAPRYNNSTGRFIYISSTKSANDYTSMILEGGKKYYLHLGYRKDNSVDTGTDQIVINSIKVYGTTSEVYNFIENEGNYESTNQGKDNTVANSYIPIDLRECSGKYNLIVNAEISSQSSDYGYATVTENANRPSYSSTTGRIIYISGAVEAKDYTTILQGGKMYYLHLGYYKNDSVSTGDDKFTVNNIKVSLNDSELYNTEIETNSSGQAITQIPFGKYTLTEVNTPEGYEEQKGPVEIEFRSDVIKVIENTEEIKDENENIVESPKVTVNENREFVVENVAKAKVIVHHYLKDIDGNITEIEVADEEQLEGKSGENYITIPHLDLDKYELEKDEAGEYVIPENATGEYTEKVQEVIYYYVEKQIPLTVHHYIEGTTIKVPLIDGTEAEDIQESDYEGESYTTTPILNDRLSNEYELVEIPTNSEGIYTGKEVEVTYFYKKVERKVIIQKYAEDGTTVLPGATFEIEGKEYVTNQNGKIEVNLEAGEYDITETKAPEGYKLPDNPITQITITRETTEVNVEVINEKVQGTVTVHHYIKGTTTPVQLSDGTEAEDEIKTGNVGSIYITSPKTDIKDGYAYVDDSNNTSGTFIDGNIEVIYYYGPRTDLSYTVNYLEKNTNNVLHDPDTFENQTFGDTITSSEKVIKIDGYVYDSLSPETLTISADNSKNIINIYYVKNEIDLKVTKLWDDSIDENNKRAEQIKVIVKNGELQVKEAILTSDNAKENSSSIWEYTFEKLIKYDSEGKLINYTLEEQEVNTDDLKFYVGEIGKVIPEIDTDGNTIGYTAMITNTFTVPDDTIDIKVNKVWEDNNNINGKRPNSIKLIVSKVENEDVVIPETNQKSMVFNSKVENNTLTTIEENEDEVSNDLSQNSNNKSVENKVVEQDENTVKETNTTVEEKEDNNKLQNALDQNTVLSSTTMNTLAENITLPNALMVMKEKTENSIVNEIVKDEITEEAVGEDIIDETEAESNVEEKTDEIADKNEENNEAQDNNNPVIETSEVKEPTTENKDVTINKAETKPEENASNDELLNDISDENLLDDTQMDLLDSLDLITPEKTTIVSTHILEVSEEEFAKDIWEYTFTNLPKYDENGNEIKYVVTEETMMFYEMAGGEVITETDTEGNTTYTATLTNTFTVPTDTVDITVNKVWVDNSEQMKRRPESVIIKLMNGDKELNQETMTADNSWTVTFAGLAKYDASGNEINYTVSEESVEFYTPSYGQMTKDGENYEITITNTFTGSDETTQIPVTKVWNDNNKDRLSSVILVLTGNGQEYTQTLKEDNMASINTWEYTFSGLPKYDDNGAEIVYTLSEREINTGDLDKYIQTVEGYTVTNTLIIKDTEISKTGPTTISSLDEVINYTINYRASIDENYTDDVTVTIVDTLPYEIDTDKPYNLKGGIYDSKSKTITWTDVMKLPVEITKEISLVYKDIELSDTDTIITNNVKGSIELSNGVKEEKETSFDTTTDFTKEITLNKVWVGDNETSRPESIEVNLKATIKGTNETGEETDVEYTLPENTSKVTVKASDNWTYTWSDLPKYDIETKEEIVYNIEEVQVPGYYNSLKQEENVFTLTNYKYGNVFVTKVDSKNKETKLGGAEFKLEKLIEENGEITVDTNFTPITKTTSSNEETKGEANFANLEYGKYRLTETKSPEGYNLLKDPIDIEISKDNTNISLEISNKAKTILPATGGTGVITLTAIGMLAIIVAMKLNSTVKVSNRNRSKVNNRAKINRIAKENIVKANIIKEKARRTSSRKISERRTAKAKRTKHRY